MSPTAMHIGIDDYVPMFHVLGRRNTGHTPEECVSECGVEMARGELFTVGIRLPRLPLLSASAQSTLETKAGANLDT